MSINSNLLAKARGLDINLSATLEEALETAVRENARDQWLRQNQTALENCNVLANESGLFADKHRGFLMQQFDIYENTDSDTNQAYPYFIDIQTDLLEVLNSRVVIPLTKVRPDRHLPNNICPEVEINNEVFYLLTYQITTVSIAFLKNKQDSHALDRMDIINSVDFLLSGI